MGGGNGTFRYKLDDPNLTSGATTTTGTAYTLASSLSDGAHTLYVQERDAVGNWSVSGQDVSLLLRGDFTTAGVDAAGSAGLGIEDVIYMLRQVSRP